VSIAPRASLLFYLVHATPAPELEQEWAAYHLGEHVPAVVAAGGFVGATRFRVGPRFTTVYRVSAETVLERYLHEAAPRLRAEHDRFLAGRPLPLSREVWRLDHGVGTLTGTAAFVVRARVSAETAADWAAWYDAEHLPAVVAAGGFLGAGRFRGDDGRAAIFYAAPALATVTAFRAGPGPGFGKEHEARFGAAVSVEREVWDAG
jgi:hypothetical protein